MRARIYEQQGKREEGMDDYRAVLRLRFDERRRGYMDALRVALDTETQLDLMRKKAGVDKILLTLNDIAGITELPDPDEE